MTDKELICITSAIIYAGKMIASAINPDYRKMIKMNDMKIETISEAAYLYGNLPSATVDGRKLYDQTKEDIIRRKGIELVKDL